jgi:hypothetical protein
LKNQRNEQKKDGSRRKLFCPCRTCATANVGDRQLAVSNKQNEERNAKKGKCHGLKNQRNEQ